MTTFSIRIHRCEATQTLVIQTLDKHDCQTHAKQPEDAWFCWHNDDREEDLFDTQTLLKYVPNINLAIPELKNRELANFLTQNEMESWVSVEL